MANEDSTTVKNKAPPKYSDEVKQKCVQLLREGKTIDEVVEIMGGPKHKAIKRYAVRFGFEIKK